MKTLFDPVQAEAAKVEGMDRAAGSRRELLAACQKAATLLALGRIDRTCTADDVHRWLQGQGVPASALGPAAGRLFSGKDWAWLGQWKKSERVTNHSRLNRVWVYQGGLR